MNTRKPRSPMRRRLVLASATWVVAGVSAAATVTAMGPSGGTGGAVFDCVAPTGAAPKITEVRVRFGRYVDSIQVLYSDGRAGVVHGGSGGQLQTLRLDADETIQQISGKYGSQVDSIQIRTSKGKVLSAGGSGGNAAFSYAAPPGLSISDFSGRSGQYLDAVGACIASLK